MHKQNSKICFPNYDESIVALSNSLLKNYDVNPLCHTLKSADALLEKKYKNVVMMIFDGLGSDMLSHTLRSDSFLRKYCFQNISSVFPPTTAAAMTSYRSGLPPISTGWLGWSSYFEEYGHVIELYRNRDLYTQEQLNIPPVSDLLPYEPIWDKIRKKTVGEVATSVIYPTSIPGGTADTLTKWMRQVRTACRQPGKQFIFAYWAEPDHQSHRTGPYSQEVRSVVRTINRQVKKLSKTLDDTLIFISADHGHVPVERVVYIDDLGDMVDCLARPLSLDDRVVSVSLKPGKEQHFISLFNQYLASDFVLISQKEVFQKKLFGHGVVHPRAAGFIGDYVIVSISEKSLCQHMPNEVCSDMKGSHSGLDKREMLVPFIVIECAK